MISDLLNRVRAEIDLDAAEQNLINLRSVLGNIRPACVVKADGYGHGDTEIMELYQSMGVDFFCVSNIEEALRIRWSGCKGDILILSWSDPEYSDILSENNIIGSVISLKNAREISGKASGRQVRVHIKLDTGMSRVGLSASDAEKCGAEIAEIASLPNIRVEGVFTHLAAADSSDISDIQFTEEQKRKFFAAAEAAEKRGVKFIHKHCLNSAGALFHKDERSTLARLGIVLYGLKPDHSLKMPVQLTPVMELRSVISQIKTIHKGDTVSYGRTYTADSDRVIATIPCGYADGYPRLLSGRNEVLINGKRAKGAGRICMDQMMADITGLDGISEGDEVTLFGRSGDEIITADDLAEIYGTIGYEVVCGISRRVPRVYKRNGKIVSVKKYYDYDLDRTTIYTRERH